MPPPRAVVCPCLPFNYYLCDSAEVDPEADEEKLARFESCLLQDLPAMRYRQVIHPVLQEGQFKRSHINHQMPKLARGHHFFSESRPISPPSPLPGLVGLKLSSVDPAQSIDLQYLGVRLPLPAAVQQERRATATRMFHSEVLTVCPHGMVKRVFAICAQAHSLLGAVPRG